MNQLRYVIPATLLIGGSGIFYGWMRNWSRVEPGMPATEPNSWIAASSDSRMQAAAAYKPIMDTQIIAQAQPRSSLPGNPVVLLGVEVRSAPGRGGFWVSQGRTPEVFVSLAQPVAARYGDSVDVTGVIRALPPRNEIHLSDSDFERLQSQGVYVEATQVSVNGPY